MFTRRKFIQATGLVGLGASVPWSRFIPNARAATQGPGLSDPVSQPLFTQIVPNALAPSFIYQPKKRFLC